MRRTNRSAGPILVTGTHRSGSTWVGKLLALHPNLFYVQEPLNVTTRPSWLRQPAVNWYEYLGADGDRWTEFDRVVGLQYPFTEGVRGSDSPRQAASVAWRASRARWAAFRGRRPLIKDPFMVFNAQAFQKRYDGFVVFTVRHPAAFADSLIRRNWSFDFTDFLRQDALMEGPLKGWEREIRAITGNSDIIAQATLLWRIVNGTIGDSIQAIPNASIVIHEEFAADTDRSAPKLYEALGMTWSNRIQSSSKLITDFPRNETSAEIGVNELHRRSSEAASAWRTRVGPELVRQIEHAARPEFELFYGRRGPS